MMAIYGSFLRTAFLFIITLQIVLLYTQVKFSFCAHNLCGQKSLASGLLPVEPLAVNVFLIHVTVGKERLSLFLFVQVRLFVRDGNGALKDGGGGNRPFGMRSQLGHLQVDLVVDRARVNHHGHSEVHLLVVDVLYADASGGGNGGHGQDDGDHDQGNSCSGIFYAFTSIYCETTATRLR